jgi:hypothetical protein
MSRVLSVDSEPSRSRMVDSASRDELHHEEGGAVLLAVVEDARDALVVDERRVAGLGAEALQEARVAHVLVLRILMATVRPITWSVASQTSPMPPIAIRESSS